MDDVRVGSNPDYRLAWGDTTRIVGGVYLGGALEQGQLRPVRKRRKNPVGCAWCGEDAVGRAGGYRICADHLARSGETLD